MGEFPILLIAVAVVAAILLAPRLRSALRGGIRGGFKSAFRSAFRAGKRRRRVIDVEADLLRACGGDKAMMERLIRYESERKPDLGRTGAALLALSRLRADRR